LSNHNIIPVALAIEAFRSSGFKSTDHALAELIDNSIQAGQRKKINQTNVEVFCVQKFVQGRVRMQKQIHEIVVYDDGGGMSAETLRKSLQFGQGENLIPEHQKGMGKFGMGLPNSSISQCVNTSVYSWESDLIVHKTVLDIDKIKSGEIEEVPEPKVMRGLPKKYYKMIKSKGIKNGGTLVVWKNLDRISWVKFEAFFKNSEILIGRMYRNFIKDNTAKIRFAAFDEVEEDIIELDELFVRANDPLMLETQTSAPSPYDEEPAFEQIGNTHTIDVYGSPVTLRVSIVKNSIRNSGVGNPGELPIGKYVNKNLGISIMRAGREIELNQTWNIGYDPTERWWGIEVSFEPDLDEIMGVTNDKQHALNLNKCDRQEQASNLNMTVGEYNVYLEETEDPIRPILEISTQIDSLLSTIRGQLKRQRTGARTESQLKKQQLAAERAATIAARERQEKGNESQSDREYENASDTEKKEHFKETLIEAGVPHEVAENEAMEAVRSQRRFNFVEGRLNSSILFEINSVSGILNVTLNSNHPLYEYLKELLEETDTEEENPALIALKTMLMAWARMEDERDSEREQIQDFRVDWGRITRDMAKEIST